jgi:hypothetical protein
VCYKCIAKIDEVAKTVSKICDVDKDLKKRYAPAELEKVN